MADMGSSVTAAERSMPEQFAHMLKNIRIFNHFEMNVLLELWNFVTVLKFEAGKTILKPGDVDDSIYIVQKGQLAVYIQYASENEKKVKMYLVKTVPEGDTVFSMLSLLDVLTSNPDKIKTVTAKAVLPSTILKLWMPAFRNVFQKYPKSWLRAIQIVALNLQHVTFDTLHYFLGLSEELLKAQILEEQEEKNLKERENARRIELKNFDRKEGLNLATAAFSELFEMESDYEKEMLRCKLGVESYPAGFILIEEGSQNNSLFYMLLGSLELLQKGVEDEKTVPVLSKVYMDEYIGSLSVLTGEPSSYTIRVHEDTLVAMIKKEDLYSLMQMKPTIVLKLANKLIRRVSGFVRQIDFVLQYETLEPGQELYKQNDPADAIYRVLSGRLRSEKIKDDGTIETIQEFSRYDVVGLVELLTKRPRATSVTSLRSSEIAKVPDGLLNMITERFPQVLIRITRLMGNFMFRQREEKHTSKPRKLEKLRPHVSNLNTIAMFPVSANVPLPYFASHLWHSLNSIKRTLLLSSESVTKSLGDAALEKVNAFRLMSWLNDQEETYPLVLYQCDLSFSEWTKRCISQADCILIVANGRSENTVSTVETQLQTMTAKVQKELVLLWPSTVNFPTNTIEWLNARPWILSFYHIRVPIWAYNLKSSYQMLHKYEKYFVKPSDKFSQFSRLARILVGRSIGLVLGGGGARGAAHVGILKAFKESAGIPVDMVGGVSIGAFIGGIYCLCLNSKSLNGQLDPSLVYDKAKQWFMDWAWIYDKFWDLTYPATAMCTGACFNRSLETVFSDMKIEDLWIPYFTITTDITSSEMRIHRKGTLWRCVRGSMTLAGYLPPICSEEDGHLLMDGGYVDSLPAGVMKDLGAWKVIAVDVGAHDETDLYDYGDALSGWWVLWNKWFPQGKPLKILDMAEIQSRLTFVTSAQTLEVVKKAPYCYYLKPPIDEFKTLDFGLFDKIFKIGFDYGTIISDNWAKTGQLETLLLGDDSEDEKQQRSHASAFTDLAAMVYTPKQRDGFYDRLSVSESFHDGKNYSPQASAFTTMLSINEKHPIEKTE